MASNDFLNRFTRQVNRFLEESAGPAGDEVRQQIRVAAQAAFERMDLVNREEFDAQRAVLLRSREKLEALERQVSELEKQLDGNHTDKA
jgi:hypothetical protein